MSQDMSLNGQVTSFAQRIEDLLTGVLGKQDDPYTAVPEGHESSNGNHYFSIKNRVDDGIPLHADTLPILTVTYLFNCSCRADGSYLQVDKSVIIVSTSIDKIPIFHYDYVRNPKSQIPSAHINVHASNDSAVKAMLACGNKQKGKNRRREFVDKGKFPTFSSLLFRRRRSCSS